MSSRVYATGYINDPVPLIEKRRGLSPGGRFPPGFIQIYPSRGAKGGIYIRRDTLGLTQKEGSNSVGSLQLGNQWVPVSVLGGHKARGRRESKEKVSKL